MALVEFFGCFLLAFGPPLSMYVITVAKDPIRVIVLVTSSFFWLISLLFSSLLWVSLKSLKSNLEIALFVSVFIQELFRYLFYIFIKKAEKGLKQVQQNASNKNNMKFDEKIISYVSGLGFGIISGLFSLINLLGDMTGPGSVGLYGDSQLFYLVSSLITLCFILLHTCWSITLYLSISLYNDFKSWKFFLSVLIVIGSHIFVSGLSLLNDSKVPSTYIYSTLISYIVLIFNCAYSIHIIRKAYKLNIIQ